MSTKYMVKMMVKKALLSLGSLFLLYRSIELVKSLYYSQQEEFGIFSQLFLAFITNLFITGIFALVGFAFPTSRLLPKSFYSSIPAATIHKWYNLLGVEFFRKGLLYFYWGKPANRKKYFNGTRSGLANFTFQSRQSEFGHLMAFISIALVTLLMIFKGYWTLSIMTTFINVVGNAYPVILQRLHRTRIDRILSSSKSQV